MYEAHVGSDLNWAEKREFWLPPIQSWEDIVEICSVTKGVQPEGHAHSLQLALASMEELFTCPLWEVVDGLFSNAILEVGIDPIEGKLMLLHLTCRAKFVVQW